MNIHARTLMAAWLLLAGSWNANATETENLNTRILPTPGKLAIDGKDVVDLDFPKKNHEKLKDAKTKGAQQAFLKNADGKGYVQEMALPWKTLIAGGIAPKPGDRINFSVEANFNTGSNFRITMKDTTRCRSMSVLARDSTNCAPASRRSATRRTRKAG